MQVHSGVLSISLLSFWKREMKGIVIEFLHTVPLKSKLPPLASFLSRRESRLERRKSRIERPESRIERQESRIERRESRLARTIEAYILE